MNLSNREIQLSRNCQLYTYLLNAQNKEVPTYIEECAQYNKDDEYDSLIECVTELAKEIKGLDDDTFQIIVNNKESLEAQKLAQWWEMYQSYVPVSDSL